MDFALSYVYFCLFSTLCLECENYEGFFVFGGEREDVSVSKKYFIRLEGFRNIRFSVDVRYAPQRFFD